MGLRLEDMGNKNTIASIETQGQRTSVSNTIQILKKFIENQVDDKIPEYQELLRLISRDYNLDFLDEMSSEKNHELIRITAKNKLMVDTGIIIDSQND